MKICLVLFILLFSFNIFSEGMYKYPSSRRVVIRPDLASKCMLGDTNFDKNSIFPDEDYPNNYYRKNSFYGRRCYFNHDIFFDHYLLISSNRSCDYESGKETKLRTWIVNQADNSIDPVDIFRASLKINNGHIFNTILTIHQLLRNEARWRSKKYYHYSSSKEKEAIFWNKFIDIRGDLAEERVGNEGDHPGSWYRMWGIALYRLSLEEKKEITCEQPLEVSSLNTLKSSMVAILAELSKYALDVLGDYKAGPDRPGKSRINNMGTNLGDEILSIVSGEKITAEDKELCKSKKYILRHYEFSPDPPKIDKSGN